MLTIRTKSVMTYSPPKRFSGSGNAGRVSLINTIDLNFCESFFKEHNYEVIPWKSYIINLPSSSDDFFASLHNKIRYDIRKGIKNNLSFEIGSTLEQINEFGLLKYGKRVDDPSKILDQGYER